MKICLNCKDMELYEPTLGEIQRQIDEDDDKKKEG